MDEFTYFGSIVNRKGGTDEDIQAGIGKERQAFAMLRPKWRFTVLTTKTKLSVFGSDVKAVILYGADQEIGAEVASVHGEHLADLVA